jgi:hypothetical protein
MIVGQINIILQSSHPQIVTLYRQFQNNDSIYYF